MKKKKKTRKPFDMSLLDGNEESNDTQNKDVDTKDNDVNEDESLQDLDFSGQKKKKKKKKTFNFDDLENALPTDDKTNENGKVLSPTDDNQTPNDEADNAVEDDLTDFDFTKKKKKKKKVNFDDIGTEQMDDIDSSAVQDSADKENDFDGQQSNANATSVSGTVSTNKWLESDRDYTYDELLEIVFNIIKEKNPEIDAGTKKKLVMRPPQVLRVGTKKSSFANFLEICKSLVYFDISFSK